ncbi:MAG: OmpH family outer membrane protein [Ferruginibacter sp.]|nr:OmpH family outer membrane protein [Bacteroidota bacterium]MBX2919256.1 OmpH family outer membrane protein [Ferruginibacter sp.]MCB0709119.1 OmpH family outer membrane protein [Chitinophagaceae bacterium]MCC7378648.1 OmpH family outer membrane protein [Chitinophagaceae bacterium]
MMKNLSLALNIILALAVGYLYYYDFSGKKVADTAEKLNMNAAALQNNGHQPLLAYVDLDSLNENITYIKDRRKELEAEMKAIETEQENAYRGLQAQKDNFLKRGAAITEEEAQVFQGKLIEQQQAIDQKKQNQSQKLNEKSFNIMDGIQKKLKEFLADYNKDKKYMYIFTTGNGLDYMVYKDSALNITKDVIKGMNAKLKAEEKK